MARTLEATAIPDARLIRRAKCLTQAELLYLYSATRNSISYIAFDQSPQDVVRVVSRPLLRVYNEHRKRSVENLPVSTQLNTLIACMKTEEIPAKG
ncbi:hypothetical protein GN244_ATG19801 [Phytophthora infestans]|nr:hypothetical protein GN244_ATG19801 [Phytophthora infestans]